MGDYITVDGERVDVPAGATEEQLRQIAAQHRARKKGASETAAQNPAAKLVTGMATSIAEPVAGLGAGLNRALGRDQQAQAAEQAAAQIRGMREGAGGWGTAGEIAGMALPGGAGVKLGAAGARALPRVLGGARGLIAGEAAAGAAYEGAKAPSTPDGSRLTNAAQGAAWGAAGGVLPSALTKLATSPFGRPTQDVLEVAGRHQQTTGERLPLTLGQSLAGREGLPSRVVRGLEEGLTALPGSRARRARETAALEWRRGDLAGQADTPELRKRALAAGTGDEMLQTMQKARDDLYAGALEGVELPRQAAPMVNAGQLVSRQVPSVQQEMGVMLRNISDDFIGGNMTAERLKNTISGVSSKARAAYRSGDYEAGEAYDAIHSDLMSYLTQSIGPERASMLARADQLHARLVPREEASKMVGARRRSEAGAYTPDQLGGQLVRRAGRAPGASGRAPGQAATEQAGRVFAGSIPPVGPGTAEKIGARELVGAGALGATGLMTGSAVAPAAGAAAAYGLDAVFGSPRAARALTGQLDWQQALADYLRQYGAPAAAGGFAGGMQGADFYRE